MTETTHSAADDAALDPFVKALLADAKRFDQHALDQSAKITRRMGVVVMAMALVTVVSVGVSGYLAVMKREVQPFVLIKDEKTGVATEVVRVEPKTWTQGEATDMASLGQYVRAREEFSDATIDYNYQTVELMSSPQVMGEYQFWLNPTSNPLSPFALYPKGVVDIEITSVVRKGKGAAEVHFTRTVKGVSSAPAPSNWIATIEFQYLTKNMTLGARLRNPFGFTVRSYNRDETLIRTAAPRPMPMEAVE